MSDTGLYDLCIVGAGLWGSAAARHASSLPGAKVCLIGPDEPKTRTQSSNREIFGAHYDEGRITRGTESDPIWAVLTQKSIERYRELEKSSGVRFYQETGCLVVGEKNKEFMTTIKLNAQEQNLRLAHLENINQIKSRFPFYNFNVNDEAVFEENNSGHISPRSLIKAQQIIAKRNRCDIIDDIVCDVKRVVDQDGRYHMEVCLESGKRYAARKVLVTSGAFINLRRLLGSFMTCDIKLRPITVAKVEISEQDARKIGSMPSTVYDGRGGAGWCQEFPKGSSGNTWFYMLPPIKYPDGKFYLKLGHYAPDVPRELTTGQEVKDWYCSEGDQDIIKATAKIILDVVKGVKMKSYHGDCCIITETPTNRPYIDMVHSQLGLAIGGNGHGAKSSDEVGRIAAMMMLKGSWETTLPKDAFKLKLRWPGYASKL